MFYLEKYKSLLSILTPRQKVEHTLLMTRKYGDKALALYSLLFDDFNIFASEDGPEIVAKRFIAELCST